MEKFFIMLSVWIVSILVRGNDGSSFKWHRDASFNDKKYQLGHSLTSRGLVHCADACAGNITCQSFFYTREQLENCIIHSTILAPGQPGLSDVVGSAYYIMENAMTTTTTPTTTTTTPTTTTATPTTTTTTPTTTTTVAPTTTFSTTTTTTTVTYPPFSCPLNDAAFRTVALNDGTHLTYRVFKTLLNQTEAAAQCASRGGFLVRVTTTEKMNTLLTLLGCPGYSGTDYFIDGSNVGSEPVWDTWVMSNNLPVPMTSDFWAVGRPNSPHTEHCIRMCGSEAYKFNDSFCYSLYYYICEK